MPIQSSCPACNQQVRVPDQLLGKKVKCPACGHIFQAGGAQPQFASPQPRPRLPEPDNYDEQPEEYDDDEEERPRRRRRRFRSGRSQAAAQLTAPGICLLVIGSLMVFAGLVGTMNRLAQGGPDVALRQRGRVLEDPAQKASYYLYFYGFWAGPIVQGLGIIVGAGAMLVKKVRGLAIAGSVIAMLPCTCCILSLPFGVWSMIVLMNDDVKDAFT